MDGNTKAAAQEVDEWNRTHPVGSRVLLCHATKTAGPAHLFGNRAVVSLEGIPGFWPLSELKEGGERGHV